MGPTAMAYASNRESLCLCLAQTGLKFEWSFDFVMWSAVGLTAIRLLNMGVRSVLEDLNSEVVLEAGKSRFYV